jgi:predicted ester cyclase
MTLAENGATVDWYVHEAWKRGKLAAAAEHVAQRVAVHFRGSTQQTDPNGFRAMVENWRCGFPDLSFVVGNEVAQGDLVALRFTVTGTHTGTFLFGPRVLAPTGRRVEFGEMVLLRFEAGRIAEVWLEFDFCTMLQQIGALPTQRLQPAVAVRSA